MLPKISSSIPLEKDNSGETTQTTEGQQRLQLSFSIIQRLGGSEANSGDIYAAAPKDHSDMTWWTRKFINEESSLM